jgi:hypothetical protein
MSTYHYCHVILYVSIIDSTVTFRSLASSSYSLISEAVAFFDRVMSVFTCHTVGNDVLLVDDPSLFCHDAKWNSYAGAASLFTLIYVV